MASQTTQKKCLIGRSMNQVTKNGIDEQLKANNKMDWKLKGLKLNKRL